MLVHKRKVGLLATDKERRGEGGVVTLKWEVGHMLTDLEGGGRVGRGASLRDNRTWGWVESPGC